MPASQRRTDDERDHRGRGLLPKVCQVNSLPSRVDVLPKLFRKPWSLAGGLFADSATDLPSGLLPLMLHVDVTDSPDLHISRPRYGRRRLRARASAAD